MVQEKYLEHQMQVDSCTMHSVEDDSIIDWITFSGSSNFRELQTEVNVANVVTAEAFVKCTIYEDVSLEVIS